MLIYVSVLTQFYESDEFQRMLEQRDLMKNNSALHQNKLSVSHRKMRLMKGYAKRMLSLYDAASTKTEELSKVRGPHHSTSPVLSADPRHKSGHWARSVATNTSAVPMSTTLSTRSPYQSHPVFSADTPHSVLADHVPLPTATTLGSPDLRSPDTALHVISPIVTEYALSPTTSPPNSTTLDQPARSRKSKNGTPPILVNLSHSTDIDFSFDYVADDHGHRKKRSQSANITRHRAAPRGQGIRRSRSRSMSNSPHVHSPKSSTLKSSRHLSPCLSPSDLSSSPVIATKEEKERKPV